MIDFDINTNQDQNHNSLKFEIKGAIISKYLRSKTIFVNAKIIIL